MDENIITILRKYAKMGFNIEIEYNIWSNLEGLLVRGKWDNLNFNYIYDWFTVVEYFHIDIEAIIGDFITKFENVKERKCGDENV